jgi:nitrite reductase/ring-hydroxylating ferredoxin subunit
MGSHRDRGFAMNNLRLCDALTSRRRFLTVVAGAVAATACAGSGGKSPAAFGDVSAGNVKDLPVGVLMVVPGQPVIIGRDAGGLYAMTITCTHQGCDVEPSGSGASASIACPCHGSRFDENGAVTRGPAASPLVHFSITVDASGEVTIHGGSQVAADVRVAVA